MKHLLLMLGAAALLGAGSAAQAQSAATGTTGAFPPDAARAVSEAAADTGAREAQSPRVTTRLSPPPADLPAHAAPGQCFARVALPGPRQTYQARVLVTPERKETRVVAAVWEEVEERTVLKPERVERITIPATYRAVTETVVVTPGRTRIETLAPLYETVHETVFRGGRPVQIAREVLVRPARPAEFYDMPVTREVTRKVIDRPARVEERVIPAVYGTAKKRKLVRPERTETVTIPAEWKTVEQTRPATERLEWRDAPCARAVTPPLIRDVQRALQAAGFEVGAPDGLWGQRTREALERFQRARGLGAGALTFETMAALGVNG